MIPIRDTIPSRRVAWVTRALVVANIAVFLLELWQGPALEHVVYRFGVVPSRWLLTQPLDLIDWPALWPTLLTSQFLHGGVVHLVMNLMYLWIFGDNVEDRLGHARFLLLYLVSGIVAALTHLALSPQSGIPMVGASGAIAGLLGAYLLLFPGARIVTLIPLGFFWNTVELPAFVFLGIWFLMQWSHALTSLGQVVDVGGVAFWAHIGGFLNGVVWLMLLRPRRRW